MKKLLIIIIFWGLLFVAVSTVQAQSLDTQISFDQLTSKLSPEQIDVLMKGESLSKYGKKSDARTLNVGLLPQDQGTAAQVRRIKALTPTTFYEHLSLFPTSGIEESKKYMHILAKLLKNITEFKTIKYQNLRDGNVHPLYLESLVLKSKDSNVAIISDAHNQPYDVSPSPLTIFSYQDMPPFGVVRSEYNYYQGEKAFLMTGSNYTPLQYRNIKAIDPDGMMFIVSSIATDQGLLLYGLSAAKIKGIAFLFKNFIENSFTSRMRGIYSWFDTKLEQQILLLNSEDSEDVDVGIETNADVKIDLNSKIDLDDKIDTTEVED